jgi:transcriptional regulator with XRE-family HTH domain
MTIDELKAWRKKNQVTQQQLAELLNTTNISVARWETGVHPVPPFLELALLELERRLTVNPLPKKFRKGKGVKKNGFYQKTTRKMGS